MDFHEKGKEMVEKLIMVKGVHSIVPLFCLFRQKESYKVQNKRSKKL